MWSHYTRDHTGAVLEFDTDKDTESPLTRAEKVVYSKAMPRLMTQADMVRFFSGQSRMDRKRNHARLDLHKGLRLVLRKGSGGCGFRAPSRLSKRWTSNIPVRS